MIEACRIPILLPRPTLDAVTAPHVYVINLDGSDRRMCEMRADLDREGLAFTRVAAVDGRNRAASSFPQYRETHAVSFLGRKLLSGEVACSLSHLACVTRFLASGERYALVLEDDSVMEVGFATRVVEIVRVLEQHPSLDWHVVHLSSPGLKLSTPLTEIGDFSLHHAHYFPMRTTAILWSRAGAQAFVNLPPVIFAPIDLFFRYWVTRTGKGLAATPALALDRMGVSEIDNQHGTLTRHGGYRGIAFFLRKQRRIGLGKLVALRQLLFLRLTQALRGQASPPLREPHSSRGRAVHGAVGTGPVASRSATSRAVAAVGD